MTGDANGQPVEGVVTLSDLAAEMEEAPELGAGDKQAEGEEGEEEASGDVEDTEESEGEGQEEQEEPTVTIKHDGKEVTLKQSEALALAQQGFDYSKKTMALAEEKKVIEVERAKASEQRQRYEHTLSEALNRLGAYTQFLEEDIGQPPPIELATQDAAQFLAKKEYYEGRKGKLQQAYAQIQHLQHEQARTRQAWIDEAAQSTEAMLRDTLPGWNDNTLNELAGYAGKLGLTPQTAELAMLTPGFWQLVQKAKGYDAIQEQKAKLKPTSTLPKVHKPSAANQPNRSDVKRQDAEKRYAAKPSFDTLSSLVE